MPLLLKPIVLYIAAVFLLRITGRRSIAQMTISQTILIISLGNIIVEPFADKAVTKAITVAIIFTILLILFEVFEYHFKGFEKVAVGEEKVIVKDGVIDQKNMKELRLTNNELYSRLRQQGIDKIEDLKKATLESNGELGYKLTKSAQPITVDDMQFILSKILNKYDNSTEFIDLVEALENKDKY